MARNIFDVMKGKLLKRLKYVLFLLIIIPLTIELSPYVLSPLLYQQSFSRKQLKGELLEQYKQQVEKRGGNTRQEDAKDEYLGEHILHPYLGFVNVPNKNYNRFCFPGPDPITSKSADTIHLYLTGGSVALGLYNHAKERLIAKLKSSKYFKNKEITIVLSALGGFKQPQQLMALNYFLSLGAQYDLVINLDGFNEIVLPYSDNLPFHVFPSYPRHWNMYSRKRLNSKVELLLARQVSLKEEQFTLNRFFVKSHLLNSNFALLFWNGLQNNKKSSLLQMEAQLRQAISQSETDYQSTGPAQPITDTTEFFAEQAALWERSSAIMSSIGKSAGFAYFHFLQPNQYYAGSKVLTEEELTIAYEHNSFAYKTAVQKGYPFLIKQGEILQHDGVNFTDLTLLFKDEKRSMYNDKCCHFNDLGYQIIADKIAQTIIRKYNQEEPDTN